MYFYNNSFVKFNRLCIKNENLTIFNKKKILGDAAKF